MKTDYTPAIVFVLKLILGITFIVAAWPKIEDPASFAKIIYGYGLFPGWSINLIAILLPFIEMTAGFALIMRLFPRSAVLVINLLLTGFILVIGFNLLRGHEFDCGCFSVGQQGGHLPLIYTLIRDVLLLAAGLYVWKKTPVKGS